MTDLPEVPDMPGLERLLILSTPVAPAKVDVFRAALPDCRVEASWHASLVSALAGVDRLRVRTGGTCHRDPAEEKTLFEVAGVREIRREVESWTVEDADSGFHCMCCGEPSLEFYKGDTLVTTLGFHHGRSLRWPEGWPGDALLTVVASDSICGLLARHGIEGPKKELEEGRKSAAAARRLWNAYDSIVEESVVDDWRTASEGDGDLHAVSVKAWPDPAERAARLFSLYGSLPDRRWRLSTGLDEPLRDTLLPKVEVKDAMALLGREEVPAEVMQGLSRWALFGDEGKSFRGALEGDALRKLATWSLSHPAGDNREEALHALAKLGDPAARTALLDFLAGKIEPRKPSEEEAAEPGGSVTYLPHQDSPPDGASEKALCAWLLSGAKVMEARPLIEPLLKNADKVDREVLKKSIERLGGKE